MNRPPKKRKNKNKTCKSSITSRMIKTRLLYYYRIERQYPIVNTEGINHSDVTAIKPDNLVEVEIKINKSDLINEFEKPSKYKAMKHSQYLNKTRKRFIIPNQYYLCVTPELCDLAIELVNKYNNKYGVILFKPTRPIYSNIPFGEIVVKKVAGKIHKEPPTLKVLMEACMRTTSELLQRSMKLYD